MGIHWDDETAGTPEHNLDARRFGDLLRPLTEEEFSVLSSGWIACIVCEEGSPITQGTLTVDGFVCKECYEGGKVFRGDDAA